MFSAVLLDAPVGGGPPARCPRRELLLVAPTDLRPSRGLPARSPSAPRDSLGASARCPAGPAAAHGYRSLVLSIAQDSHLVVTSHVPEPTPNFACNSPTTLSNYEFTTLELQRF